MQGESSTISRLHPLRKSKDPWRATNRQGMNQYILQDFSLVNLGASKIVSRCKDEKFSNLFLQSPVAGLCSLVRAAARLVPEHPDTSKGSTFFFSVPHLILLGKSKFIIIVILICHVSHCCNAQTVKRAGNNCHLEGDSITQMEITPLRIYRKTIGAVWCPATSPTTANAFVKALTH